MQTGNQFPAIIQQKKNRYNVIVEMRGKIPDGGLDNFWKNRETLTL